MKAGAAINVLSDALPPFSVFFPFSQAAHENWGKRQPNMSLGSPVEKGEGGEIACFIYSIIFCRVRQKNRSLYGSALVHYPLSSFLFLAKWPCHET